MEGGRVAYRKLAFNSIGLLCCLASVAFAAQKPQLVQTFEYDQPDERNFDPRPVLMKDGSFLERVVNDPRQGEMMRFSPSGQLLESFAGPRSFGDANSFVVLNDGT